MLLVAMYCLYVVAILAITEPSDVGRAQVAFHTILCQSPSQNAVRIAGFRASLLKSYSYISYLLLVESIHHGVVANMAVYTITCLAIG